MVHKPAKPENIVSSYRPISLLPAFSKIFERILLRRLLPILEAKNIIPEYQFGFRQQHGTPEQCHRVIKEVRDALENKKYCSAIFLDVQQAFDKVCHPGLLYKVKKVLPAPYYLLFKSYLSKRHFFVNSRNETSALFSINAGIPQGSVLGPVLYTLYTSDMPTTDATTVATYADDTAILSVDSSPINASRTLQIAINQLEDWFSIWNIKVNPEKSAHITFTLRRDNCTPITLNNCTIPRKDSVKYLGLHLDRRLTWEKHIKAKKEQLNLKNRKLYWLMNPKSQLSLENKVTIYKTILKPVWTYGIQLWGTASHSNIEILQRYQNKTLRYITNAPWYMTNYSIHKDLQIATVKEEINTVSHRYLQRLSDHCNPLAIALLDDTYDTRRLKRFNILDLPFRNTDS